MNRTLVIGATGLVGRQVASQMVMAGESVRALVRHPETAQSRAEIEVVRGDLTFPETLDRPPEGIDSVFLVWTAGPEAVISALQRISNSVSRVVFLSDPLKTKHPFFQQPNATRTLAEKIEQQIEQSCVD
jgi:uncharacterized protein YbjT (DUF2867 family)